MAESEEGEVVDLKCLNCGCNVFEVQVVEELENDRMKVQMLCTKCKSVNTRIFHAEDLIAVKEVP